MSLRSAFTLLVLLFISGCGSEKTDLLFECPSPDGNKIATIYHVSNGENDVSRETKLNVRPASATIDSSMFSFSMRHGFDAIIRWHGDDKFELIYPEYAILTHQEQVIFGTSQTFNPDERIRVSYAEKPSTHGYFVIEKRCFSSSQD